MAARVMTRLFIVVPSTGGSGDVRGDVHVGSLYVQTRWLMGERCVGCWSGRMELAIRNVGGAGDYWKGTQRARLRV